MKAYLRNISLWLRGFAWLWTREIVWRDSGWVYARGDRLKWTVGCPPVIVYKPGWSPWKFLPVYLLDHGIACVFLGLGVQPISRWAGQRVKHAPWRWLAWALNKLDAGHTDAAGGLLWQTTPCPAKVRLVVMACWALILGGLVLW